MPANRSLLRVPALWLTALALLAGVVGISAVGTAAADPTTPVPGAETSPTTSGDDLPTDSSTDGPGSDESSEDAETPVESSAAPTSESPEATNPRDGEPTTEMRSRAGSADATVAAADAAGCGYGEGGENADTICWLDMTSYDDTLARTTAGQDMSVTLPGGYTLSYNLKASVAPTFADAAIAARAVPIETRFAFATEAYRNIPGRPSLYSQPAPGTKGLDVTLSNIRVEDPDGNALTSFSFVATDTEDNVAGESLRWTSDKPLDLLEVLYDQGSKGCKPANMTGFGTTTVTCNGVGGGSTLDHKSTSVLVSADAPTSFGLRWVTFAQSGIAFGVNTASIEVTKIVDGRADRDDSFDVSVTSPEGSVLGSASTGTAATATTGPVVVIPPNNGAPFTLTDAVTPGSGADLADYTSTWSCTRNGEPDPSLPSGEHSSVEVSPGTGDQIACTVTNRSLTFDGGDAPASYGTTLADGGPRHSVTDYDSAADTAALMLGSLVDTELDGAVGDESTGDDTTGIDDEDGIADDAVLARATSSQSLEVEVHNATGGQASLHGWIDADGDGAFQPDEYASAVVADGANTATLQWTGLPALGLDDRPHLRLRLTTTDLTDDSGSTVDERSGGAASDGEVEDHRLTVEPVRITCQTDPAIFNTAYDGSGGKLAAGNRDRVWQAGLGGTTGPDSVSSWIPAWVVNPVAGAWSPSPYGNADWISYFGNTSQGSSSVDVYFRYRFRIDSNVSLGGFALPMDFYADNSVPEVWVNGVAQSPFEASLPQSSDPYFYQGFRAANRASTVLSEGFQHGANEIVVRVASGPPNQGFMAQMNPSPLCTDTGDAPDTFGTTKSVNGAAHGLPGYDATAHSTDLMLGSTIDADIDGLPGASAGGDDGDATDDEDAIVASPVLSAGATTVALDVPVTNATGGSATLHGWIDANGNGVFQAGEHASAPVADGATSASLAWSGLAALQDGSEPYVRLRLTTDALTDDTGTAVDERSRGAASDGEVEDHRADVATAFPEGCGNPFVETFGTGTGYGPPLSQGQTTYLYEGAAAVNDGEYGLVSALPGSAGGWWHTAQDRTPGDTNGRLMVINASFQPGQFFQRTFTGLEVGSTYDFSAWITNANNAGSPTLPNVTFRVVDPSTGTVLEQVNTGSLPNTASLVWSRFGTRFEAPQRRVRLELVNNAPGGNGNDLAIDDVAFNLACEFGDAPATYRTSLADNGPVHRASGPQLGAERDGEGDGLPTPGADGDDSTDTDDEDGVAFNPDLGYPGPTIRAGTDPVTLQAVENTLEVTASDDGFVSVWVDWNQDGDFGDADERVANAQPVTSGSNDVTFTRGAHPANIRTYVRARFSTDAASVAEPTGPAPDGEVEDYRVLVERLIAPAACAPVSEPFYSMTFHSIAAQTGAGGLGSTTRYPDVTVVDGVPVDMMIEVRTGSTQGWPVNGMGRAGDDAAWNIPGGGTTLRYHFYESGTTTPIAVNGVWAVNDMDNSERTRWAPPSSLAGYALTPGSEVRVVTSDPRWTDFRGTRSGSGDTWSRYQVWFQGQTQLDAIWSGFQNSGFGVDGDGDIPITPSCADYGDAPAGYATREADNGPRHTIDLDLLLGSEVEFDGNGQPTVNADGDDANRIDDEDGVLNDIAMTVGEPTTVDVVATNDTGDPATLVGWLDSDSDGAFEAEERVALPVAAGTATYPMVFPAGPESATTAYARFRLFPGTVTAAAPTGPADGGEVEDYPVRVLHRGLEVVKGSDATADSRPGDEVTYTITVTNTGEGDYTSVNPARVVDDLTDVLDDADYNGDATATVDGAAVAAPTYADPRLSWSGPLAAGDSVVITYTATLVAGGDATVRNVAWVPKDATPGPTPDCDDPATTAPCAEEEFLLPKLRVTKRASRTDLPSVGQTVTYTVTIRNVGPGAYTATGLATFTDDLSEVVDDADLVDGSITSSSGTVTYDAPELAWSGELPPDGEATVSYTFEYHGEGDEFLVNTACAPEDEAVDPADACGTTTVPGSGLDQAKTADPASGTSVGAGDEVTYRLRFTNTGETTATVDTFDDLSDVLDDATLTAGPVADGTLTATFDDVDRIDIGGTVPVGETFYVTYTVTVDAFAAQGDHVLANVLDCQPGDPPSCVPETTEHRVRHATITKTADVPDGVDTGDTVTYTLTIANDGTGDFTAANPAVVVDDLSDVVDDAVLDVDDVTASAGEVSYDAPELTWTGPLAADGDPVTISYTVTVTNGGDHELTNAVTQVGCEDDPSCAPDPVVTPLPFVVPSKSSDPASGSDLAAGDVVRYILSWTNDGEATGRVDATDDLSQVLDDAEVISEPASSSPAVTANRTGDELRVEGPIDVGDTVTVTYQVRILPDGERGDDIVGNVLAQDAPQVECDQDGNCEPVEPPATQHLVGAVDDWKTADPASGTSVQAGDEITYTLHFTNTGAGSVDVARDDVVADVLDDAEIVSGPTSSDPALAVSSVANGRFTVTGTLTPDQTVTVSYTVQVRAADRRGDDMIGNVLVAPGADPPADCASADPARPDCTVHPVSAVDATKKVDPKSGSEVAEGDRLRYTLRFTNTGEGPGDVDHVDHLEGVLDDAELVAGPDASDPALDAVGQGKRIRVAGTLEAGQTVRVRYTVRVNADGDRGDSLLANFLVPAGVGPPAACRHSSDICTANAVASNNEEDPGPGPGPGQSPDGSELPDTGAPFGPLWLVVGLLALLTGIGLVLLGRRRTQT